MSTQHQVRVGVVGLRRGRTFARILAAHPEARLAALHDHKPDLLAHVADAFDDLQPVRCRSFVQLLDSDIDAVVLANDATAHVPLAVAALDAGKHVLSEVPAAGTMAEAVQLVEAAERSHAVYMMAENYCFAASATEMRRRYQAGDLGEFQHGEGEYVHDTEHMWPALTGGQRTHWRNWRPSTFYCTHSLGPLLHITGTRVKRVVAMETPNRVGHRYGKLQGDSAVLICQTSTDATIKSLQSHGGIKREPPSTWLSVYGTRGSMETNRWDRAKVSSYLVGSDGGVDGSRSEYTPDLLEVHDLAGYEDITGRFRTAHGGSDFITTHTFLRAAQGRCASPIDAFRATDMSMPGLLAYRSIVDGNVPYDVPDLREKADRDRWRDDHWGVGPLHGAAGVAPRSCSYPVDEIPDETFHQQAGIAAAAGYPPVERM